MAAAAVSGQERETLMPAKLNDSLNGDLLIAIPGSTSIFDGDSGSGAKNQYWLFTRKNRVSYQLLVHDAINSVKASNYKANRMTYFIVHGWIGDGTSPFNTEVKDALLDVQNCNVIVVDWHHLASGTYGEALNSVPSVGKFSGKFLVWLSKATGGNWDLVHLIGYSLGAHVVGIAGREIGGRAKRVTGLDPAGPGWTGNKNALNPKSGRYVEAIHTNPGILGIDKPLAHADFYPNSGGLFQPGCFSITCSHQRSYQLFASSVRYPNRFIGRQCSPLNSMKNKQKPICNGKVFYMGNIDNNKSGSGIYCLETLAKWPY